MRKTGAGQRQWERKRGRETFLAVTAVIEFKDSEREREGKRLF